MLNPMHFRDHVIRPTLEHLGLHSLAAENLLLGTALAESGLRHLVQLGGGPALGVYQMEPATHDDIWENYLSYRRPLKERVQLTGYVGVNELIHNLAYATAMCRVHYLRVPERLPPHNNLLALGRYWKTFYNSELGKGTVKHFVDAWKTGVGDLV